MRGVDALVIACIGRRWGTVVWGGAGYGIGIDGVRALDARRFVYLEPNKELRARLAQRYAFSERETLSGKALWSQTGFHPLIVVSDPLQSSLLPRDELLNTWPNLRETDRYKVETQSLDEFVREHEVEPERDNLLVLELCGAELEVLSAADEALLARFTHIAVHHESDARGEEPRLLQLLLSRGYELVEPTEESTGGWLLVRRERLEVEAVPTAEQPHDLRIRELEAELDRARSKECVVTELQEKAERELQLSTQRETQLGAELQQAAQRLAQIEAGLQQSAQHAIHLDSELQKALRHAAQLAAELEQCGQRATQMEANLQQFVQRTAQLETDLQQTRQTMRMAVQMQAQREVDLSELQARYRDGQDALERQHVLLDKLGERLGLASDYFHQLLSSADDGRPELDGGKSQGSSNEIKAGTVPRGSVRARKASKPKSRS